MPGLKKHYPDITFSGNKVTPDEIDQYIESVYLYPSVSASHFGTAAAITGSTSGTFVILNQAADYPRTPLVTLTCASNTITVGTVHLVGTDQFGAAITEDISIAGTSGVTIAGTKIWKTITAGTITTGNDGGQGTAKATITLGVAIGTAANQVARFGLGTKIGAVADVKMLTWINNGTATELTDGTIAHLISATTHSFAGTMIVGGTHIYKTQILSTYNGAADPANMCA